MTIKKLQKSALMGAVAAAIGFMPMSTSAQSVDSVLNVEKQGADAARKSQQRIDRIADETQNLLSEYQTVSRRVDDLRIFNAQLQRQVNSQLEDIAALEQSIDDIEIIKRQIVPEMLEMVASLEKFVQADIPFRRAERMERVNKLTDYLEAGDISAAEQFRQILEALQIEVEYGRSVETYRGPVTHNGTDYESVEFLRLGRVGLFYKAAGADTSVVGMFDRANNQFTALESSYAATIEKGIAFADKRANAELLMLPVQAPEGR